MSPSGKQKRKICMVGSYAVGKTSLVEQFVHSIYSDAYHTTVGVKIDKKVMQVDDTELTCVIWDIAGEDEFYTVSTSYLRGMAGFFLVVDCTRKTTVDAAHKILDRINDSLPKVPFVLLVNKTDLTEQREVGDDELAELTEQATKVYETSAKTGTGVEDAFDNLARAMLGTAS